MKKLTETFRNRLATPRENENGMEAAQVILILVIVVVALIPIINGIVTAIRNQGTKATNAINNA
jgi:Flp pilus assembly pilin Flp